MSLTGSRELLIERLGHRGDGVAQGPVFVPYALPNETVTADVAGERGRLLRVEVASPDRIEPFCAYFGSCGGCAIQHLAGPTYRAWKQRLVVDALSQARIEAEVADLLDAHGAGRRRATLHARRTALGFAEARSHGIVDIKRCPILLPSLDAGIPAARAIARMLSGLNKPLDILMTMTRTGLDIDLRGAGRIPESLRQGLTTLADTHDLARLAMHGDVVVERRRPLVLFGTAAVSPPAGAFLQATEAADDLLAGLVAEGAGASRRIADLFSGCGTFSLVLAEHATIAAFDSDKAALKSLERAARETPGLRPVKAELRDLFHRPLLPDELNSFDAVVFDPPRAGAEAQARRLAASRVKRVVAVSCSAATFARDAAILLSGGYRARSVIPVDQFRHSAHVEIVACFER